MLEINDEMIDVDQCVEKLSDEDLLQKYDANASFIIAKDWPYRHQNLVDLIRKVGAELETVAFPHVWDPAILQIAKNKATDVGLQVTEDLEELEFADSVIFYYRVKKMRSCFNTLLQLKRKFRADITSDPNRPIFSSFAAMNDDTDEMIGDLCYEEHESDYFEVGCADYSVSIGGPFNVDHSTWNSNPMKARTKIGLPVNFERDFEIEFSKLIVRVHIMIDQNLKNGQVRDLMDDLDFGK